MEVATEVMAERKFDLRGWEFTDPNAESTTVSSVLGLIWNRKADTLRINTESFQEVCSEEVTKRTILSSAHKIFDPLGITCPVSLLPKLLLQRLWKTNMTWDQKVDLETEREFRKWLKDVPVLSTIEIPRWIRFDIKDEKKSLHVFCDASRSAYATCVFLRVESENCVHIQLVQAKARVAPCGNKETSIARLELLGATIAARLSSNILEDLLVRDVYYWTDSTTVLAWIRREDSWGVFVQNRVTEILSLTSKETWRYAPVSVNPADLPSRRCTALQLSSSKWWEGPAWLYSPSDLWPNAEDIVREEEINSERKKKIISSMLTVEVGSLLHSRTNDYKKTIRIVAWIRRFYYNCFNSEKKLGDLTVHEIEEAEKTVVHLIQRESFTDKSEKRLKTLDTFVDEGILRLKTAVFKRFDIAEFRMPAVCQENIQLFAAKNIKPPTAPPPADRVQDACVFQVTGLDFAIPVYLRDNSKAWICLFTCAVYRAFHLALVTSLSTDTFLLAFHRFIARRGKPSVVYSDNGSNITGAANILKCVDFKGVSLQLRDKRIIWKFIPPGAPWWGGWWERLIGMMKAILKKVLGRASLNHEEMTTAVCNCEAILNNRPLTAVTSDPSLSVLTPADFLREIKSSTLPDIKTSSDPNHLRRRLSYIQTIREAFRSRFRQEYLGALCTMQRNQHFFTLKVGELVLVGDDEKKRQSWPLGRIVEVFPGSDGIVRRVKVKAQHGDLFRAIQRIYPLEVPDTDSFFTPAEVIPTVGVKNSALDSESAGRIPVVTRAGRVIKCPQRLDL